MASTLILTGLGLAAIGYGSRYVLRTMPNAGKKMADAVGNMKMIEAKTLASSRYYKGGFDPKMTKREAALILGVPVNANSQKVRAVYKKMMIVNHPDRGGSPYLSAKINEAKDLLDN